MRRTFARFAVILTIPVLGFALAACSGGEKGTPTAERSPTSLDDFVSSASPICSKFTVDVSAEGFEGPVPYEDAASALAELALPSDSSERERAEGLVAAMGEAAVATREFSNAVEEYIDPGESWSLTENGRIWQGGEDILSLEVVSDFPTETALNYMAAKDKLGQAAAGVSLPGCAWPEQE